MPDTKTPDGKTLSVGKSTLSLKPRTETGVVRQSFSHGRSKQVVVEVKKRRVGGPEGKAEPAETRKRDEDDRRKHDEETKRKADEVAKKRFGEAETTSRAPGRPVLEADEDDAPRFRRGPGGTVRPAPPPRPQRTRVEKPRG